MGDQRDRRQAILDTATRLLAQYGPNKTTMADIAREAGIGVGSLYLEFQSKDDIVAVLSGTLHEQVLHAMRKALLAARAERLDDVLAAILEARTNTFLALAQEGAHACELVFCMASPVQSAASSFKNDEIALYTEILEAARAANELADDLDPKRGAALFQRALLSISPPYLYKQARDDARRTSREMARLVACGLLARGKTRRR